MAVLSKFVYILLRFIYMHPECMGTIDSKSSTKSTNPNNNIQSQKVTWVTTHLLIVIFLFMLTFTGFYIIANEIVVEKEGNFDESIFNSIAFLDRPANTKFFSIITFFGSREFLFPAYSVLIIILLFKKSWKTAIEVALIGAIATVILFQLKSFFARQRPLDPIIQHVTGYSFPSGHSFSSFTFFGVITYLIWKTPLKNHFKIILTVLLFVMGCLVAFSRVYLHVHYPSDVLGGFLLSIFWLILSIFALNKLGKIGERLF